MLKAVSILYKTYFFLLFATSLLLLYPAFYWHLARDQKNIEAAFKLKKLWARILFFGSFNRLEVKGKENLHPSKAYIICPNHSSYLDIIVAYLAFDDLFLFMGKAELLKWPLFKIFFKHMDIAVQRGHPIKAARAMILSKNALACNKSLVIFPEGTISKTAPALGPFKPGAFKLSTESKFPVVPVTFNGNSRVININSLSALSLPGKIEIIIHPPVFPEQFEKISDYANAVKSTIDNTLWK